MKSINKRTLIRTAATTSFELTYINQQLQSFTIQQHIISFSSFISHTRQLINTTQCNYAMPPSMICNVTGMHVVPNRHKLWTLGHKPSTREPSLTSKTSIHTMGMNPPSSQLCHGCKDATHHHIIIKIVIIALASIQSLFIIIKNLIYFNHEHHINAIPLLQQRNYHNFTIINTT